MLVLRFGKAEGKTSQGFTLSEALTPRYLPNIYKDRELMQVLRFIGGSVSSHNTLRAAQNLLHLPALRQLIHQLIQKPNLLRQSILDFLHTKPTDYSGNEVCIGV